MEAGYTYTFDDAGDSRTIQHSYPEMLLRYGVGADWLELRIGWNYMATEAAGVNASGADDLSLGLKIFLTPQDGILPEMTLIPQMTVPTGSDEHSASEPLPGLNLIYGWDLNDALNTSGSTQFNRTRDATGESYIEWAQSWATSYSLNDRAGAYIEWYALFPHSAEKAGPEHYFDGGITYLFSDDIQWDIRGGTGLNGESDDYFFGTGLSFRFR